MNIIIRKAALEDYLIIESLYSDDNRFHAKILPHMFNVISPIIDLDWYEKTVSDNAKELLIAFHLETPVGLILLVKSKTPNEDFLKQREFVYIEDVVVSELYRSQGIGKMLMSKATDWASENNISTIELDVWNANKGAISFYESLGYDLFRRRMKLEINDQNRN